MPFLARLDTSIKPQSEMTQFLRDAIVNTTAGYASIAQFQARTGCIESDVEGVRLQLADALQRLRTLIEIIEKSS